MLSVIKRTGVAYGSEERFQGLATSRRGPRAGRVGRRLLKFWPGNS